MKSTVRISLFLAALVGLASTGFGQGSTFFFNSSATSWIGQGETVTASSANGYTITGQRQPNNMISISISSQTRSWFLDFAAPDGGLLAAGQYIGAAQTPNPPSGVPGMNFYSNTRTASTVLGYFEVTAVEYGAGNTINRFDANFLQYDEGQASNWNQGSIQFDGLAPVPEPGALPLIAAGLLTLLAMKWRRPAH